MNINYNLDGEVIVIAVNTHQDFIPCEQNMGGPFAGTVATVMLPPEIKPEQYPQVVVSCTISEEYHAIVNRSKKSGEEIFYEVVANYANEHYPNNRQIASKFCNHFEYSFKYIYTQPKK